MVGTIELAGRGMTNLRQSGLKAIYLTGTVGGGLALGGVLGSAGIGARVVPYGAEVASGLGLLALLLVIVEPLEPRLHPHLCFRQVKQSKFWRGSKERAVFEWGLELGVGVRTKISGWTFWGAAGVAVATQSFFAALAVGVMFGVSRGVQLFIEPAQVSSRAPLAIRGEWLRQFERRYQLSACLGVVALVTLGHTYW